MKVYTPKYIVNFEALVSDEPQPSAEEFRELQERVMRRIIESLCIPASMYHDVVNYSSTRPDLALARFRLRLLG